MDDFITDVYALAEHCGYGDLHDEMVHDRIVVGIRDSRLSEKLQLDPNLTLEKAIAETRQKEAVKKQQSTVRSDLREETSVEPVRARFRRRSESGCSILGSIIRHNGFWNTMSSEN